MHEHIVIAIAVPLVLGLSVVEARAASPFGHPADFERTVNDLLSAVGHLAIIAMSQVSTLLGYRMVLQHTGLFSFALDSWFTWLFGAVLLDLVFYLRHRAMHRVAFLWTMHEVHHQSHQYTFATALRLGWLQDFTAWPFLWLLAVVGVPVEVTVAAAALNHGYQFFLHTQLVPRLVWTEGLIATPSTHRVHHGCNARYIDRNYGAMLTIWDHLFGTFEPEVEPVIFGTTRPMASWDPVDNNVRPIVTLLRKAWAAPTWASAMWVLAGPPAWVPGHGEPEPGPPKPRVDPTRRGTGRGAVAATLAIATVVATVLTALGPAWSLPARLAAGTMVLVLLAWAGRSLGRPEVRSEPAPTPSTTHVPLGRP